jgi:hypothetical protein
MADIKIQLPEIENGKSYRSWRQKLVAQMRELDAWEGVRAALEDPNNPDDPIWPAANNNVNNRRNNVYRKSFGAMARAIKLGSEIDNVVVAHQADSVISYLRVLDREFLALQDIDLSNLSKLFNTEQWDYKKEKLGAWINRKWCNLLRLVEEYPNDGSRNIAMCRVLCDLVPSHFATVTNRYRTNRPNTWRELEQALKDFETASPCEKAEKQGVALNAKVDELQKKLDSVQQEVAANFTGGKGNGRNNKHGGGKRNKYNNGKKGEVRKWHNKHSNNYNNYNKQTRKGDGKKGAKRQKGSFDGTCNNCGGYGHSAKYCPSGKTLGQINNNNKET